LIDRAESTFGDLVRGVFGEIAIFGLNADFFHSLEAGFIFETIKFARQFVKFGLSDFWIRLDVAKFTRFAVGCLHDFSIGSLRYKCKAPTNTNLLQIYKLQIDCEYKSLQILRFSPV